MSDQTAPTAASEALVESRTFRGRSENELQSLPLDANPVASGCALTSSP